MVSPQARATTTQGQRMGARRSDRALWVTLKVLIGRLLSHAPTCPVECPARRSRLSLRALPLSRSQVPRSGAQRDAYDSHWGRLLISGLEVEIALNGVEAVELPDHAVLGDVDAVVGGLGDVGRGAGDGAEDGIVQRGGVALGIHVGRHRGVEHIADADGALAVLDAVIDRGHV